MSISRLFVHQVRRLSSKRKLIIKSIDDQHGTLIINDDEVKYDWIFLRDSCQCSQCVDSSTRQKLHHTASIPLTISPAINGIEISPNKTLEILWNDRQHRSSFSFDWLKSYSSARHRDQMRYHRFSPIVWNRKLIERVNLRFHVDEYLHSDEGFAKILNYLDAYGLVFLDDVQGELAVERLTERIGEIRRTFYGKSWDVKSVEKATNIAYTSQPLGLHMDLLYFESPPGLQFLHCLTNTVRGGASYYMDSFRAGEILRDEDRSLFDILLRYPVTFHYRNAGRHFHFTRPTIVLDRYSSDNRIDHINYSPPFQGPFEVENSSKDFRQFLRAFQRFHQLIEDKENQLELKLEKGQCAIFHNRRILHARRAFDASSGDRWLKGCYTDLDNFRDRLRIVRENFSVR